MRPLQKFSIGNVSATIWNNDSKVDGRIKEFKTVSFEKSYKDKDNEWQKTNSLGVSDLPKAMVVIGKAYEYLSLKHQEDAVN